VANLHDRRLRQVLQIAMQTAAGVFYTDTIRFDTVLEVSASLLN